MPPGRMSKLFVVVVKPFGPHHCAKCFGSVQASNTSARGASKTRVAMIARGSRSRSRLLLSTMFLVLSLQPLEVNVQPVVSLLPELPIFLEPFVDTLERLRFEPARPHLRVAP